MSLTEREICRFLIASVSIRNMVGRWSRAGGWTTVPLKKRAMILRCRSGLVVISRFLSPRPKSFAADHISSLARREENFKSGLVWTFFRRKRSVLLGTIRVALLDDRVYRPSISG